MSVNPLKMRSEGLSDVRCLMFDYGVNPLHLNFSIKSSTHYLLFLRNLISAMSGFEPRLTHEAIASCSLAMVEAVNNAIFHAHKKEYDRWIDIKIDISEKAVTMEISDSGGGFEMPEFDTPPVDHIHGRGLFIIGSLMNKVVYRRGKRNVLKMVYYV